MTVDALTRRHGVGTNECEASCRVIKLRIRPRSCAVARITRLREACLHVVRVRGPLKILQMARNASGDSDVVVVRYVAVDALARRHCVRTRQHEARGRVIKRSAGPSSSVVTLLACLREAALNVVRIRGPLEVFQMARYAGRNCDVVVVRNVTIDALAWRNCVRAG